jgi:hypothetical protein
MPISPMKDIDQPVNFNSAFIYNIVLISPCSDSV